VRVELERYDQSSYRIARMFGIVIPIEILTSMVSLDD